MKHVLRMLRMRTFQALAAITLAGGVAAATVPAMTASAATASPKAPAAAAGCAASSIRAWLGIPVGVAAGTFSYELELSNISSRTCTLHGYPGVSALSSSGAQLGSPAGREAGDPERTVTLTPGATSHVLLLIEDVANYSASVCAMKPADELKVYPPNDTGYKLIPLTFEACSKKAPVYLHVRVDVAGTGIPGYSF